ncbi:unnamed protein product [Macrosiphum euphorbiae]|uniref:Uncharacterized protein n=1 Tax=Macrosiphum euphorbiae TaxID=13131 RepID=A0AAV0Y656_9HEMI|nr:unnamed protein product [Macrosiphum euphorbiae]
MLSTRHSSAATGSPCQVIQYSGQSKPLPCIAGVLRVGGRLTQSSLPYDMRHPVILTKGTSVHNYGNMLHPPSSPACWSQCQNVSGAAEVLGCTRAQHHQKGSL